MGTIDGHEVKGQKQSPQVITSQGIGNQETVGKGNSGEEVSYSGIVNTEKIIES